MIEFKKITMRNFLSVGDNEMTIDLSSGRSVLVSGQNGSGKSSVLADSISYVLFNKSYRGINKPNLVNTSNQRGCVVTIDFVVNGNTYHVIRGMHPGIFDIHRNGEKLDNHASARDQQRFLEHDILRADFRSFCQTCILGTATYIPFMQLSTGARRDVTEKFLDISLFSEMNKILKGVVNDWKAEIDETKTNSRVAKNSYDMQQEFVQTLERSMDDKVQSKKDELAPLKKRVQDIDHEHSNLLNEKEELVKEQSDRIIEEQDQIIRNAHDSATELSNTIRTDRKKVEFFDSHSSCPKCGQDIDEEYREEHLKEFHDEMESNQKLLEQRKQEKSDAEQTRDAARKITSRINEINQRLESLVSNRSNLIERGKAIVSEIQNMSDDASDETNASSITSEKEKLEKLKVEYQSYETQRERLLSKKNVYTIATRLLKDSGIKSSIIRQYLPILNARVNHYLNVLNFNLSFELDEQFNETLRARYKNEFSYANFSMGERQRLDLAMAFAWRDVAKMKNSVNANIMIFDEVFDSSLDEQGTEDLMAILSEFEDNTTAFVISHRNNMEDKFDRHLRFHKENGFSKCVEVT